MLGLRQLREVLEALVPLIEMRDRVLHAGVYPLLELLVEVFRTQAQHLLKRVASAHAPGKRVHHVQQLAGSPLVLDIVADATGLEVRHEHLRGIFGPHEPAIQIGDRQQLLVPQRHHDLRSQRIAPFGRGLSLLVHGEPFGEPTRHAMLRCREDEDVAHLVTQRARPVKVTGLAPRRTVHGEHVPKGHAERPETRHSQGPDREVLVIRVNLHLHGA